MPKILTGLMLVVLLVLLLIYLFINKSPNISLTKSITQIKSQSSPTPSPSPFPFQELTIPELRARKYESNLGNLQKISENSSYTSYLTNFTSDGFKINGLLTIPKKDKPAEGFPAIVFVHGYIPPNSYQTLTRYSDHVDYLAKNDFVVFKIDLRGHGDSEGEPSGAYYSNEYIVDVLNAYSALQSSNFVNREKIGLWGHSMAGNVISRALAARPDIPAIVIWAGAVYTYKDLNQYGIQDSSYQPQPSDTIRQKKRQQLRALYGDPKAGHPFWDKVAPTNYLSDIRGAIQLNHAVNDDVVSIDYSRNLNSILDKTQIPHELHEYPSGGHNITGPSFTEAMQNTVNFFKKHL